MKSRKIIAFIMALCMTASLVSCGSVDSSADDISAAAGRSDTSSVNEQTESESESISPSTDVSSSDETEPASSQPDDIQDAASDFEENDDPIDDEFKQASFSFAAELFRRVCSDDIGSGKNTMVSPTSVMQALVLAANGADGETLAEFEKLLGGKLDIDAVNKNVQSLITSIKKSEDVKFSTANSIWIRQDDKFSVLEDYKNKCSRILDAGSFVIPFDSAGIDKINSWVEKNTNGMIKKLINDFTPLDLCVLANCIAFEGEWNSEYEDDNIDENGKFTNALGEKEDCVMLTSYEKEYIEGDGVIGFAKYYKGGQYKFVALLPDEGSSVKELAASLTGEKLSELLGSAESGYSVKAIMPEFKFDYNASIQNQINEMGIDKAFTDKADFSKLSDTFLEISEIIHKTHIELDRKGTKAAAATAITMKTNSIETVKKAVTVNLDRPYMFAILDAKTNLPIFIGTVDTVK